MTVIMIVMMMMMIGMNNGDDDDLDDDGKEHDDPAVFRHELMGRDKENEQEAADLADDRPTEINRLLEFRFIAEKFVVLEWPEINGAFP